MQLSLAQLTASLTGNAATFQAAAFVLLAGKESLAEKSVLLDLPIIAGCAHHASCAAHTSWRDGEV